MEEHAAAAMEGHMGNSMVLNMVAMDSGGGGGKQQRKQLQRRGGGQ